MLASLCSKFSPTVLSGDIEPYLYLDAIYIHKRIESEPHLGIMTLIKGHVEDAMFFRFRNALLIPRDQIK